MNRKIKLSELQFKQLVELNMDDLIGTEAIDKPIYGMNSLNTEQESIDVEPDVEGYVSLEEQPGGTGGTPPVRYRIDAGGCLKCTGSFNPANCPYVDSDCTSTSNSSQETWTCKKGKCTKVIGKGGIGEFSSQQECEDSYCEERARPTGDNRSKRYDEGADLEGPSKYGYGNDAPFKDSPNFNVGESLTKRVKGMLSEVEEDYDKWDQEQLDDCCLHEPDFITDGCCANGGNPDGMVTGGNHGRDNHMWDGKSQMTTGDEREGEGTSLRYRGNRISEIEEVGDDDELGWGCCCNWINWAQYSEPECESWGCRCDGGGPTVGKISGEPIPDHSEEVVKDGNIVVIWPRRRGFVPEDREGGTNNTKRKDRKGMGENSHHLVHRTHEELVSMGKTKGGGDPCACSSDSDCKDAVSSGCNGNKCRDSKCVADGMNYGTKGDYKQAKRRTNSTQPVNGHKPRPTHSNQNVVETLSKKVREEMKGEGGKVNTPKPSTDAILNMVEKVIGGRGPSTDQTWSCCLVAADCCKPPKGKDRWWVVMHPWG